MIPLRDSKFAELKLAESRLTDRNIEQEDQSLYKTPKFSQEVLIQIQRDRQYEPLCTQEQEYTMWKEKEEDQAGKVLVTDGFTGTQFVFPEWQQAKFFPGGVSYNPKAEIGGRWESIGVNPTPKGCQIKGLILRTIPKVTYRSLAADIRVNFRLQGDSSLWIYSRADRVTDPDAMVCRVRKEGEIRRAFIILGAPIGPHNEFKFFKKVELPDSSPYADENDSMDIKLRIFENGDDRVLVEATTGPKTSVSMICNKFIPTMKDTRIMVAGSGDSVFLKNFSCK